MGNGYLGGKLSKQADENSRSSQTDEKASISKTRELCYYIRDEQGSVRYVLDQSGNVVNEYQYSAFGETRRVEEYYENRLRYNGQMHDGLTEQYYLRARYYQPQIGRFTQEDFLYEDGLNLYAYCKSNPVMYCDPSGLVRELPWDKKVQAEKACADGAGGTDEVGSSTNRTTNKIVDGATMKTNDALDVASEFLGEGYTEPVHGSGRFVSSDGRRVFRMGENDILGRHGGGPHVNFEILVPNSVKPGKMQVITDIHNNLSKS